MATTSQDVSRSNAHRPANERERGYLPIENYGMIGNMRTVAMCGTDGSIDFFCYPKFDSPSVFARILDQHKGGHFAITPLGESRNKQQYLPNSNVLQTRFLSEQGVVHVTDYMPVPASKKKPLLHWLNRVVECKRGTYTVRIECFPAFDYARAKHTTEVLTEAKTGNFERNDDGSHTAPGAAVVFKSDCGLIMDLRHIIYCSETSLGIDVTDPAVKCPETKSRDGPEIVWNVEHRENMTGPGVWAEVELKEGQRISLAFRERPAEDSDGDKNPRITNSLMESLLKQTFNYWIKWIGQSKFAGRWREVVHRSALALKLMTYEPTGAVVAAPTFGMPEAIGGERNWDYRYTWIRDSAFTIYALIRIGLTEEAEGFMAFIEARCQELTSEGGLQVMYTIDGAHELPEVSLEHLEGYRGSKPVRIGNGAYDHLQLDIYGELLDSIYLYNKYRAPVSYDTWCQVRRLVNYVCNHWNEPDMSIWEVRGVKKHFTYSKVMCWVALDRGLRLADKRSLPCPDRNRWLEVRDEIYESVMTKGWSKERQCFIQCYEDKEDPCLDASVLIMPLCFFISPSDPRMISTLKQIMMPPEQGGLLANNLVFRYDRKLFDDGLADEQEGSFSMCKSQKSCEKDLNSTHTAKAMASCTFWLVEALTRAGRQHPEFLERAIVMFEQMIAYGNHLTLFSEEIAGSGEMLGNFPQAFTHIAMMSAAFNLDRTLSGPSYVG